MDSDRIRLYDDLEKQIGNTPLVQYVGEVPNGNRIWIKRECDNPFGSHYDRVYLKLFRHYEERGRIKPEDGVFETTSGAAGVSFAGLGKILRYNCFVAMPAGGEKAREEAIKRVLPSKDHLILTPAEDYVNAFPDFIRQFMKETGYFFMNHSMGPRGRNNELTLSSLEGITRETIGEIGIDYFVPAVGNGSSVLGPARVFSKESKVIPFETVQSAVAYDLKHPGEYEQRFGIKPGTLSRHQLPGTSYQGISFPHVNSSIDLLDDVILVSGVKMDEEYQRLTGRKDSQSLPHWDDPNIADHEDLGRSSRAGLAVALEIAKRDSGKSLLIIGYDKIDRYDS
jgi:cysteine synthase A